MSRIVRSPEGFEMNTVVPPMRPPTRREQIKRALAYIHKTYGKPRA